MFDVSAGIGGQAVMDGTPIGYIVDLNTDPVGIIEATIRLTHPINYDDGMVCRITIDAPDVAFGTNTILPGAFVRINTGMPLKTKEDDAAKAWLIRWARR